jgi:formylglycine-generating enzyme required for sulfatase activity
MRLRFIICLVACGHSDAPQQNQSHEDAPRSRPIPTAPPIDAPQPTEPQHLGEPVQIVNIEPGEPPASMVVVSSEPKFFIDRTEVTVGAYRECVDANACQPPQIKKWTNWDARRPVTLVSPQQAWDYCAYRGKRLPTPKEWVRAALGEDGRKFPWGNTTPSCKVAVLVHCSGGDVAKVGTKPFGASPYGALDMAGNVNEFVNSDTSGQRERINAVTVGGDLATHPNDLAEELDLRAAGYATVNEATGIRCARMP